jgi:hypothetical protein
MFLIIIQTLQLLSAYYGNPIGLQLSALQLGNIIAKPLLAEVTIAMVFNLFTFCIFPKRNPPNGNL